MIQQTHVLPWLFFVSQEGLGLNEAYEQQDGLGWNPSASLKRRRLSLIAGGALGTATHYPYWPLVGDTRGVEFWPCVFFTDENPVLPPFDGLDEATWGPLNVAKEYQHVWELHKEFANRAIPARNIDWFLQETASEATPFFHVFSEAVVGWIWYDDLVDGATEKALWTKACSLALMISSAQKTSIFSTSYSQGYLKGGRLVMM